MGELRSRKANLGFSSCSLKATRWDIASPHIRSSLFGTCSTTPIYIYILPPKILCHIYVAEESIYIISPNVFIPRINPGLKSAWEIGPPTGLEGCRFVDLRRGDALVGKGRGRLAVGRILDLWHGPGPRPAHVFIIDHINRFHLEQRFKSTRMRLGVTQAKNS